jgi:hypothetical protein
LPGLWVPEDCRSCELRRCTKVSRRT